MRREAIQRTSAATWQHECAWTSQLGHIDVPPEGVRSAMTRRLLACAWGLKPKRVQALPALTAMLTRHYLTPREQRQLPDPDRTAPGAEGLCGIVADTTMNTLMAGMRRGLYPLGHVTPMKWWSPDERCVVYPVEFKIEKNLARRVRNSPHRITFDRDPLGVLTGCAAPRPGRPPLTWITPDMMRAALMLFEAGHMHSVEVWNEEQILVGGLYGYAIGRVFTIESQFHTERDTSKLATVALLAHLANWRFAAADGKQMTNHLKQFGFRNVPRRDFRSLLEGGTETPNGRWHFDESLDTGRWQPSSGLPPRKLRRCAPTDQRISILPSRGATAVRALGRIGRAKA